jgi:hypothetical protein
MYDVESNQVGRSPALARPPAAVTALEPGRVGFSWRSRLRRYIISCPAPDAEAAGTR